MAQKSRCILCFKIIIQNQIKCQKVSCFGKSNVFFFYLNVIILHLTNVQHVLDWVLTKKSAKSYLCVITKLPKMVKTIIFLSLCVSNLLTQCGDIEVNPGPKYSSLIFCHWNLNGLTAHDNIKIWLLQVYVTQYKWYNMPIWNISKFFYPKWWQ